MKNELWIPVLEHMILNMKMQKAPRVGLEVKIDGEWRPIDYPNSMEFVNYLEYRIKPNKIVVNGVEIDYHMNEINLGDIYYTPNLSSIIGYTREIWRDDQDSWYRMNNHLVFDTCEKAKAYTNAVLGIEND